MNFALVDPFDLDLELGTKTIGFFLVQWVTFGYIYFQDH